MKATKTMKRKCQSADRNYCAPRNKIAALFVDIDGTVAVCQPYFDRGIEEFSHLMSLCGFSKRAAKKALQEVYYGRKPFRGYDREKFGEAIADAYDHICKKEGVRKDPLVSSICQRIGTAPFFQQPELFPNALPVLTRARHNFLIVAVTVGTREVQKYKIGQGGLSSVFDDTIFTLHENKADLVQEFIEDNNVCPHHSAFIGNSMRSDGVTLNKTNFVYLPLEISLASKCDKFPENTGFELFNAHNWTEAEERAIKRLIRRRRLASEGFTPGEDCEGCDGDKTS